MTRFAIDSPARQQRDRLIVAAAETVLRDPFLNAIYVVLPADAIAGPSRPMQVNISASACRSKRTPEPAGSQAGPAAMPAGQHHVRWIGTLLNETDGLR